jgi:hypothetical protein
MLWVDTVYTEYGSSAICVKKDGAIVSHSIDDLEVCPDSKQRILLDPEKLQQALAQRLGGINVSGMRRSSGMNVERISPDQLGRQGYRISRNPPEENEKPDEESS